MSVEQGSTILQIIFTPPSSPVIRDNLFLIYENREYRIYSAYVTGVTALRSGLEIFPSTGILLLNTATWFVDITRPRGEVITIFARDFADILHCIKAAIALPFFAIGGLIFPSDVFGLFKNMPGIQIKVKILEETTRLGLELEDAKTSNTAAIDSLERQHAAKKEELQRLQDQIKQASEKQAAAQADHDRLSTIVDNLTPKADTLRSNVEKLETTKLGLFNEESALLAKIQSHKDELQVLGTQAGAAHRVLAELRQQITNQQEALGREIESLDATKATLGKEIADLQELLRAEKEGVESTLTNLELREKNYRIKVLPELDLQKKTLEERKAALEGELSTLQQELQTLRASITEAIGRGTALKVSIADQESALREKTQTVARLTEETSFLDKKVAGLKAQEGEMTLRLSSLNDAIAGLVAEENDLKTQELDLARQIADSNQALTKLKETLARTQETLTAERQKLDKARTQGREDKTKLESEIEKLTASTEALRGHERTLIATVRAAEDAQQTAIARTSDEESKPKAIKKSSPAKAKLGSPARTTASSPDTAAEDLKTADAKLRHKRKELEKTEKERQHIDKEVRERRAALDVVIQESTAYKKKLQAEFRTTKEALAQVKVEKEQAEQALAATMSAEAYTALITRRLEEQAKLSKECIRLNARIKKFKEELNALAAASAPATSENPTEVNGESDIEAKQ